MSLKSKDDELAEVFNNYASMVYRIAFMFLKNVVEAEDATQTVFVKLLKYQGKFEGDEHIKAWLIITAKNTCKDELKSWRRWLQRHNPEQIEQQGYVQEFSNSDVWEKVMSLNNKYKLPIYLYYYEGYSTLEISDILCLNHATVRTHMRTARKKLKIMLEEEQLNESQRANLFLQ
ncbi:RNA polymerase sigma factor [Paenibacillus gorillae]|uniref:RNA polymerase sigma factor n=1 Tax=Paenibacillus gorillae TaxID=1243662 RepID=UPI0004B25221|nr:sigma-70 family RNA polymerase sigma factor [Paenibacillus gorillae]